MLEQVTADAICNLIFHPYFLAFPTKVHRQHICCVASYKMWCANIICGDIRNSFAPVDLRQDWSTFVRDSQLNEEHPPAPEVPHISNEHFSNHFLFVCVFN